MDKSKRSPGLDWPQGLETADQYLYYLEALHRADQIAIGILTDPDALMLAKSIYRLKRFKRLQKSLIAK